MTRDPHEQKKAASDFWKRYFDKFRQPVGTYEVSETAPAPRVVNDTAAAVAPPPPSAVRPRNSPPLRRP